VLPGPADRWGGTGPTSGIRSHQLNVLFDLKSFAPAASYNFITDILSYNGKKPPLLKITVNGKDFKFRIPAYDGDAGLKGESTGLMEKEYRVSIPGSLLRKGGNSIRLTILEGSWLIFDDLRLEGHAALNPLPSKEVFIRNVETASYNLVKEGIKYQPLLIDVEHLEGRPENFGKNRRYLCFDQSD
jgi:hypothetical protein